MKASKRIVSFVLIALLLASFAGCTKNGSSSKGEYAVKDEKLRDASPSAGDERVFYEVFVGSFSDSNGDGIGDLKGVINRMDYLNDGDPASGKSLGVEGIWLTPIFSSPSYHKYDVTDYYTIDPDFGTMDDLKTLIDLCHERGVKVIIDLPINHTGRKNEWYTEFRTEHQQGLTDGEYYDFYSWYDGTVDSAPAGRSYSQILGTEHYYECNFSGDMPELNFDNPLVRQKVLEVAEYYIDLGIDGFRFDAAKYVYFGDHNKSLEFWEWYMGELRAKKPDIYAVAEVWDGDGITDIYFKALNCFDFTTSQTGGIFADTANKGDAKNVVRYVESYVKKVDSLRSGASFTPFITNHDMDRAAGFLNAANGTMQMAVNLYILGPGTPFIYYGEELGMRGSRGGANTDANRRLKMEWGDEDTIGDPIGTTYPKDNRVEATAAEQIKDENSLYNYYKKVIRARRANPEIASGTYTALMLDDSRAAGFISELDGSRVVVFHNPTGSTVTIDINKLAGFELTELRAVLGMGEATLENGVLTLSGQTSVIIK